VRVAVTDLTGPEGRTIAAKPNVQCFRVWYVKNSPKATSAAGGGAGPAAAVLTFNKLTFDRMLHLRSAVAGTIPSASKP
jgi:hypothetical protein